MFYSVQFIGLLLQHILKVASFDLSLVQYGNKESNLLFDRSSSRAFCYPSEEMMSMMADTTSHHHWGYTSPWNYSVSMQRVGQVLCRQNGFSIYQGIEPKKIEEKREKILWAANCLGYETSITHCLYEQFVDPELNCTNFVGLKCSNCDDSVYVLRSNEKLSITSPGFPSIYNDHSMCRWTVKKKVASPFIMNIKYLSLPSRSDKGYCSKGFFEVRSMKGESSGYVVNKTLCGLLENKIILVEDSILNIKLVSGVFHPRPTYGPAGFSVVISILQDLQTKGRRGQISDKFSVQEKVGISLGAITLLIILMLIILALRLLVRKIRRRKGKRHQKTIAKALHRQATPANPCADIRRTPLPAVPRSHCSKMLNTGSDQGRKSSLNSVIYEDIFHGRRGSYLQLEEISKKDEETGSHINYDFKIPTFLFTPYDDDNKSAPSDTPTCSFSSDFDSVFESDTSHMGLIPQNPIPPVRKATYTIVKSKNCSNSSSINSVPISICSENIDNRLSDHHNFGQRCCFSDSDVSLHADTYNVALKMLRKTYTQRFSLRSQKEACIQVDKNP